MFFFHLVSFSSNQKSNQSRIKEMCRFRWNNHFTVKNKSSIFFLFHFFRFRNSIIKFFPRFGVSEIIVIEKNAGKNSLRNTLNHFFALTLKLLWIFFPSFFPISQFIEKTRKKRVNKIDVSIFDSKWNDKKMLLLLLSWQSDRQNQFDKKIFRLNQNHNWNKKHPYWFRWFKCNRNGNGTWTNLAL